MSSYQQTRLLSRNVFIEGRDAYNKWSDDLCESPVPVNPYPEGSQDRSDWETGFSDAEHWILTGQYED